MVLLQLFVCFGSTPKGCNLKVTVPNNTIITIVDISIFIILNHWSTLFICRFGNVQKCCTPKY